MERDSTQPIIVCPLAFERYSLVRSGVGSRVLCIGPGAGGVERLGRMIDSRPGGPVILAGVAGAVDPELPAGSAYVVSEVVCENGSRLQPTWQSGELSASATIATSREVLRSPEVKRAFAQRTGAQLVDQESEPFALLASERGWAWGIARGISDELSTTLPPDIHRWVDEEGRTRMRRVLCSLAARPRSLGSLLALRRNSGRAMDALAELLQSQS